MNLPNYVSMSRVMLVPCFFMALYYHLNGHESVLFWCRILLVCIIVSDFLDGYIARKRGEITSLGSLLDPLADKLFVVTSFVLLAVYNQIPPWLAIIVVTKDILVSIGWCFYVMLYGKFEVKPSFLGKSATGFQFLTVCVIILFPNKIALTIIQFLTAVLTISALFHYVYQALQQASDNNLHRSKGTP